MTTIVDVAQHAGVSIKTVSRVLNGEPHVRPAMKARVEAAARELGYRPNLAARQLAGHKSFIIAYPFNNPSPAYITEVMMGAAAACRDRGYHLVSEPVDADDSAEAVIQRLISTLRPDGVIVTPPLSDDPEFLELMAGHGVPLIRIAGQAEGYGRPIQIDERGISAEMVRHLVSLGHRRIGFVRPHPDHLAAQSRTDGYLDGLAEAGIAVDEALIQPGDFTVESGLAAAKTLLALNEPPTAIFAANDYMALGVMRFAHESGLSIPGQLAIAGFDDTPSSRLSWPPLTTIRQPARLLGEAATLLLMQDDSAAHAIHHELVIRGSTVA